MTVEIGCAKSAAVIKRISRLVMIPISFPSRQMGTPEILYLPIRSSASLTVFSGERKNGLTITPFSLLFTRSTMSACLSIAMFLWITPTPPSRAIAIAIAVSVTVSIAAVIRGVLRRIVLVRLVETSTLLGSTSDSPGIRRTSSKVSPSLPNLSLKLVFSIILLHSDYMYPLL